MGALVVLVGLATAVGARAARGSAEAVTWERPLPVLPPLPVEYSGVTLESRLAAWVPYDVRDDLLRSAVLRDPEFARRVHWWIAYWSGPASDRFPDFLGRMATHVETVDSALATYALPPSLRYLPLIESGYATRVTSHASARGMWQLMAPTARELGLYVGPLHDERTHPRRSTWAAVRYLTELNQEFDSWFVTLAAYNTGPTRVRAVLRRHAAGVEPSDSLFWALRGHFAPETREFLPKLFGAMWVANRPQAYGFAEVVQAP